MTGVCSCTINNWPGTKHVWGQGPLRPRIMIVGEAPGAMEDQDGVPFSGGAGRILDQWLGRTGIKRAECFVDNVVSHRPPGNDISLADLHAAYENLKVRIRNVEPNLVLLLGNTPLRCFVDGNIGDWRGSYFQVEAGGKSFQAVAAYHPAYIMRDKKMWDVTLHDLMRARDYSRTNQYWEPSVHYITHPSHAEAREFIDEALRRDCVVVDIETDYSFAHVDLVGLCYEPCLAISVPTDDPQFVYQIIRFLRNTKGIATHDSIFDAYQLRRIGMWCPAPKWNTLLYSHILYQHLPHDLGFLGSIYTPFPYWKDQIEKRKEWYNCRDVDATMLILLKQFQELRELDLISESSLPSCARRVSEVATPTMLRSASTTAELNVSGAPTITTSGQGNEAG